MKDESRTKKQLVCELTELRDKLTEHEALLIERRRLEKACETALLKYRSLANAVGEITFEHDVDGNHIIWSGMVREILGYSEDEMGHDVSSWEGKVHPDDIQSANAEYDRAAKEDRLYDMEYRFRHKDGHYIWFNDRGSMQVDSDGNTHVTGVMKNITERKLAEEAMNTLSTAVQQSSDWILIADKYGKIEYVNDAVENVTGYTREEILGNTPRILKSGRHDRDFYKKMWDTILSGQTYTGILTNRRKNGELFEVYHTISPIKDKKGAITHFVAASRDITPIRRLEERINFLAFYDDLTGLPNRALFTDRLKQALVRSEQAEKSSGVFFIDIDRFHMINDTRGAGFGDALLKEIARRLSAAVREGDTVARLGSDEYALTLNNISKYEDIIYFLEDFRERLSQPVKADGEESLLTFSIGISVYPDDAGDVTTLIQNADLACQEAKQRGGNTYRFFTSGMNTAASEFISMEKRLKDAIKNREFILHYQPYWDCTTKKMTGMEALIRWNSRDQGLISPAKFIPVLEETGLIVEVGEWVFRSAIRQIKEWQDKGYPVVPVSVNLSIVQFRQKNLVGMINSILEETGLAPSLLTAEITESGLMEDTEFARKALKELRDRGISISIDDFGTGYSSLSYIKKLPVDNLKIDMSFIHELGKDPYAKAIVSAIITMAAALNLHTIAEGVETEEQWEVLKQLNCQTTQGYYFARPLTAEDFEKLLARQENFPDVA